MEEPVWFFLFYGKFGRVCVFCQGEGIIHDYGRASAGGTLLARFRRGGGVEILGG